MAIAQPSTAVRLIPQRLRVGGPLGSLVGFLTLLREVLAEAQEMRRHACRKYPFMEG